MVLNTIGLRSNVLFLYFDFVEGFHKTYPQVAETCLPTGRVLQQHPAKGEVDAQPTRRADEIASNGRSITPDYLVYLLEFVVGTRSGHAAGNT